MSRPDAEATGRPFTPEERPALRRCIAVDPALFAGDYWSTRLLLSPADQLSQGFEDLLSLADVDELLSRRGLRTPFLRIAKDGRVIDAARFTRSGGIGAGIRDQVSDDRVLELFADGCTLVLQGLHRVWPPLVHFGTALAAELGHPVQVNAYVTPPQSRGFSAHYDTHDVFVLQVAGDKRWIIHEPVVDHPLPEDVWTSHADAVAAAHRTREPALDTVLRTGDALYLPRGWLHAAEALGSTSLHLTVGVHPVTRHQLAAALLAAAAAQPQLRASLPLGVDLADGEAGGSEVRATVAALSAWLDGADTDAVLDRVRQRAWEGTRPGPIAPLAQAHAVAEVSGDTRIRRRDSLRCVVRRDGEHVVLYLADRVVTLAAGTEAAVRAAVAGGTVAVAQLPGLDAAERVTLARRLLREAVVVPVPR